MARIKAGEKTWADRLALVRKRGQERLSEILTPEQVTMLRDANSESAPEEPAAQ